ncbi:MAG: hypothetical protein KGJ78_17225 [Alphaproteobacteria bacterium]|nr:hypothetical protein [Alphaproteobacteria bacterium]
MHTRAGGSIGTALLVAVLPLGGCAWVHDQFSATPPAVSAPVVDPFADIRPSTASVGVVMTERRDFMHPWDVPTYIMRVTLFGTLPAMNGGIAFVGDSLTDWGRWSEAYPGDRVRNFGIAGDTTVGLEHRLSQVIEARPATIFLMIGTNDVEFGRAPQQIAGNVADILDRLHAGLPAATIYLESLLPRLPEFAAKVQAVNALFKEIADKRGLTYIDLYPHFVANGRLDPRLTSDDIHVSGQGYARWREILSPYITAKGS